MINLQKTIAMNNTESITVAAFHSNECGTLNNNNLYLYDTCHTEIAAQTALQALHKSKWT